MKELARFSQRKQKNSTFIKFKNVFHLIKKTNTFHFIFTYL